MTEIVTEIKSYVPSKGISGSSLKLIAIFTMLLDHIGASLLMPHLANAARAANISSWSVWPLIASCPNPAIPYYALRCIGRIAFPIFCFLLVEGFLHTKNLIQYAMRLAAFALISEIPFDLAFHHALFYDSAQNVFFTLLIGLLVIAADQRCFLHAADSPRLSYIGCALALFAGMYLAELLHTDYGYVGILTIFFFYKLHQRRLLSGLLSCCILMLSSSLEITAFFCIPLLCRYNGIRGLSLKYAFYLFYPLHLLLLYFASALL